MRRSILTLFAALAMLLSFGAVASAEETEPEPCVPGVVVYTTTSEDNGNIYEVTRTTTCTEDGQVVVTEESHIVAYYITGAGIYVQADEVDAWMASIRDLSVLPRRR